MTQMIDTEGLEIPIDLYGNKYFDVTLCDWTDGKGPAMTINVPEYFRAEDGSEYDGMGIMTVPIQSVLEDYLRDFKVEDEGLGVPDFCKWLRDHANRLESANTTYTEQQSARGTPMKIETGVMIMKDGKAWGVVYADGHSTSHGWVNAEDGKLYDQETCKHPTDATYKGSPETAELSTGKLVAVERRTEVVIRDT